MAKEFWDELKMDHFRALTIREVDAYLDAKGDSVVTKDVFDILQSYDEVRVCYVRTYEIRIVALRVLRFSRASLRTFFFRVSGFGFRDFVMSSARMFYKPL
jgi:hypothetical protein